MATPQTNKNSNSSRVMDFQPVDFNAGEIPPEIAPGEYTATAKTEIRATNNDKWPMIQVKWKIDEATDDANANFVGAEISDFIVFNPDNDPKSRFGKLKLKKLSEMLGFDLDLVPTRIQTKLDLKELCDAIDDQQATVYVTAKQDKETGETRANVQYTAPRGMIGAMPGGGDEEEEDDRRSKKAAGGKKSGRR